MKKILLLVIVIGLNLGLALYILDNQQSDAELKAAHWVSQEAPTGGDFTLTSSKGSVSLHDFQGKLVLIYFGYTFCPDICPTNLGNLSMAYQQLSDAEKEHLQILFISVDPKRDTPERLQQYAHYFNSGIIGLTGTPETLDEIAKRYGVIYAIHQTEPDQTHYAVDHSAFTYVVDANGKLQTQLPHATTPQQFLDTIRQSLPPQSEP